MALDDMPARSVKLARSVFGASASRRASGNYPGSGRPLYPVVDPSSRGLVGVPNSALARFVTFTHRLIGDAGQRSQQCLRRSRIPPGANTGTRRQCVATATISRWEKRRARLPARLPDFDTMALTARVLLCATWIVSRAALRVVSYQVPDFSAVMAVSAAAGE